MKHITGVILVSALAAGFGNFARADILTNGGFETTVDTVGLLPDQYGVWRGDMSEVISADGSQGLSAFEGGQILNFQYSHRNGPYPGITGSELWQIVDVSNYADMIADGNAIATGSAWFTRIAGDEQTDTLFSVTLAAYSGDPADFAEMWLNSELAYQTGFVDSDDLLSTWEMASTSILIPVETDFLVMRLSATENVFDDGEGVEFDGHYADGAFLSIHQVPAPATATLLLGMGMGVARRTRRRRS